MPHTILNNTYRLEQELSRSASFILWRATNVNTGHGVAVKTVLPEAAERHPDFSEIFVQAAQDCARITHPGINAIIEAGQDQGLAFAAANLVNGASLSERLRKHGALTIEETAVITADLAAALRHIHSKGYLHRNLKTENVLLWKGTLTPILTDFGILKPEFLYPGDADPDQAAAPELLSGQPYAVTADIFALAAIAFMMLTGSHPYREEPGQVRFASQPQRLRSFVADAPEDAEKALMRALARDPAYRFESVAEFARAFCGAILPHLGGKFDPKPEAPRATRAPMPAQAGPLVPAAPQQSPPQTFDTGGSCFTHPDRRASGFCVRCGKPLCPECEILENGRPLCAACRPAGAARLRPAQAMGAAEDAVHKAGKGVLKYLLNKELRRIAATLIDIPAVMLAALPPMFLFWAVSIKLMPEVHGLTLPVSYYASLLFVGSVYYIGAHYRWGKTLGKHVLGLQVRHKDGSALTLQGAFWRWIGFLTGLIWAYIGFWLMLKLVRLITLAKTIGGAGAMHPAITALLMAASALVFLVLASGAFITFIGKFKRGFHDILASSIVVNQEWMERRIASESQGRKIPGPVHRK